MPLWLLFAMLVGWEASQWLIPSLTLDPVPFACTWTVAATLVAIGALRSARGSMPPWREQLQVGSFGALALGAPAVLLLVAQQHFAVDVAVASLAAVPVVVVVATGVLAPDEDVRDDALMPALGGLAGALLLVPVGLPANVAGWIGFLLDLLAVGCVGCFGVLTHRRLRTSCLPSTLVVVAGGNAVIFAVAGLLMYWLGGDRLGGWSGSGAWTFVGALFAAVLTILLDIALLKGMRPSGFAARFLLIPFITALEGYLLWRPTLSFRSIAGAGMMLASAVFSLRVTSTTLGSVVPVEHRE